MIKIFQFYQKHLSVGLNRHHTIPVTGVNLGPRVGSEMECGEGGDDEAEGYLDIEEGFYLKNIT